VAAGLSMRERRSRNGHILDPRNSTGKLRRAVAAFLVGQADYSIYLGNGEPSPLHAERKCRGQPKRTANTGPGGPRV
jgi:hypothetical protein